MFDQVSEWLSFMISNDNVAIPLAGIGGAIVLIVVYYAKVLIPRALMGTIRLASAVLSRKPSELLTSILAEIDRAERHKHGNSVLSPEAVSTPKMQCWLSGIVNLAVGSKPGKTAGDGKALGEVIWQGYSEFMSRREKKQVGRAVRRRLTFLDERDREDMRQLLIGEVGKSK